MSLYTKLAENSEQKKPRGRPFLRGVSGNPGGRPPKSKLQREMEKEFNNSEFVEQTVGSIKRRMNSSGMAGVLETKHWSERVDGPVKQEMDVNVNLSMADMLSAARKRIAEDGDSAG
jgi:hypothetical protein